MPNRASSAVRRHGDGWSPLLTPLPRKRYRDSEYGGAEQALQALLKDLSAVELEERHRRQTAQFGGYEHDSAESPLPGLRLLVDPLLGRVGWSAHTGDGARRFTDMKCGALALNYAARHVLDWRRQTFPLFTHLPEDFWFELLAAWQPGKSGRDIRDWRHGGSISEPDPRTLQARISYGGTVESKTFAMSKYGGRYFAAAAAVCWLNQRRAASPRVAPLDLQMKARKTSGVPGAHRAYLAGAGRSVTDQDEAARTLALAFRTLYEHSERDGSPLVAPHSADLQVKSAPPP